MVHHSPEGYTLLRSLSAGTISLRMEMEHGATAAEAGAQIAAAAVQKKTLSRREPTPGACPREAEKCCYAADEQLLRSGGAGDGAD